ncbi:hypothetical protein J2Z66_002789 [Paenibacillus eucommiae]|uniref:Uncharacterized protein n=1 Tax=Paenibacillus eucommiae TaxID=1355755 RepID=A0ABS4IUC5_9BACL|nr:hypothetical protein [Paenibacillus eucommiae]
MIGINQRGMLMNPIMIDIPNEFYTERLPND